MTTGKDFLSVYLERQEKDFEKWCSEKKFAYITDANSEERRTRFAEWKDELKKLEAERLSQAAEAERLEKAFELSVMVKDFERITPKRYRAAGLNNIGKSDDIRRLAEGASGVLLGSNGTGKTWLAWAMGHSWVQKGESVKIVKAQEMLHAIKCNEKPYDFIRKTYDGTRHLIIDEIDKIFESKADFVYLNYLIDRRYEWMRQTVVIGNGNVQAFIAALGQSIFSRLCGEGGVSLEVESADRRFG